mmetsp:Transcript_46319/g.77220  ORF Transcript_46319/g.77220 Transcript_46319/m.77220 type:complete len:268 (+) Transcript_46319:234-1037(+)
MHVRFHRQALRLESALATLSGVPVLHWLPAFVRPPHRQPHHRVRVVLQLHWHNLLQQRAQHRLELIVEADDVLHAHRHEKTVVGARDQSPFLPHRRHSAMRLGLLAKVWHVDVHEDRPRAGGHSDRAPQLSDLVSEGPLGQLLVGQHLWHAAYVGRLECILDCARVGRGLEVALPRVGCLAVGAATCVVEAGEETIVPLGVDDEHAPSLQRHVQRRYRRHQRRPEPHLRPHQDEVARCRAVLRVLRSVEHGHTLAVLQRAELARDPM